MNEAYRKWRHARALKEAEGLLSHALALQQEAAERAGYAHDPKAWERVDMRTAIADARGTYGPTAGILIEQQNAAAFHSSFRDAMDRYRVLEQELAAA